MPSVGPNAPSAPATQYGTNVAWANLSNVGADDDLFTTAVMGSGQRSRTLVVPFAFEKGAFPDGAIISGIEVSARVKSGGARDNQAQIGLSPTGVGGANLARFINWTSPEQTVVWGGPGELWGQSFTPDDLAEIYWHVAAEDDSEFGSTASVDFASMTAHYRIGSPNRGLGIAVPAMALTEKATRGQIDLGWQRQLSQCHR